MLSRNGVRNTRRNGGNWHKLCAGVLMAAFALQVAAYADPLPKCPPPPVPSEANVVTPESLVPVAADRPSVLGRQKSLLVSHKSSTATASRERLSTAASRLGSQRKSMAHGAVLARTTTSATTIRPTVTVNPAMAPGKSIAIARKTKVVTGESCDRSNPPIESTVSDSKTSPATEAKTIPKSTSSDGPTKPPSKAQKTPQASATLPRQTA